MKAFVTGATGFLGWHLTKRLVDDGWGVRALVRPTSRVESLRKMGVELAVGDVRDAGSVRAALEEADAVFHAAGNVDLLRSNRREMLAINVEGTRNVLAAAQAAHVPRVVHFSSVAAIGRRVEAADETVWHEGSYASPYEESKHRAEQVALEFGRRGLGVVHVLPSIVVGYGDPKTGAVIKRYLRGRIPVRPAAEGRASYVHIDRLVDGVLLAYEKGRDNERYILSQVDWTTTQLFDALAAASGIPPPRRRVPTPLLWTVSALVEVGSRLAGRTPPLSRQAVQFATRRVIYRSGKARAELGWRPGDFSAPFAQTVHAYQQEVGLDG